MPKKKSVRKINLGSSFFAMHKHARWLLGIFLLVSFLFLGVSYKGDLKQKVEFNKLLIRMSQDVRTFIN